MRPRIRTDRPAPRSSRDLVLTALRARGPMSRAELARYAGVAPSTISGVVQDLIGGLAWSVGLLASERLPAARAPWTATDAEPAAGRGRRRGVLLRQRAGPGVRPRPRCHRHRRMRAAARARQRRSPSPPPRKLIDEALAAAGLEPWRAHRRRCLSARPGQPSPGRRHAVGHTSGLAWRDRRRHRRRPRRRGEHRQRLQPGRPRRARLGRGTRLRRQRDPQVPQRHRVRAVRQRHPRPRRRRRGRDRPYHRRRAGTVVPLRQARLPGDLHGHPRHPGGAAAAVRGADEDPAHGAAVRARSGRGASGGRRGRTRRHAPGRRLQPARAAAGHRDRPDGAGRRTGPGPDQDRDPAAHRPQRGPPSRARRRWETGTPRSVRSPWPSTRPTGCRQRASGSGRRGPAG